MPRPAYIICSQSYSLDEQTRLLSAFHLIEGFDIVLETIEVAKLTQHELSEGLAPGMAQPLLQVVVNAAWMRCDGDTEDQEFEHDITMKFPGDDDKTLTSGLFTFSKTYQRFTVVVRKVTPWVRSGMCIIEARIRPKDSEQWLSQEYHFPITVRDLTKEE